jgi:acetoin utilization protein AcuB
MDIKDLILYELPVLTLEDSGTKALSLMRDFHIYHLPIIVRDEYIALISEDDILDWDHPNDALGKADFLNFRPAVFDYMHPIEAIKIVKEFSLSVIPILDRNNKFLGCATQDNFFSYLTDTNTYEQEGGILILQIDPLHFSLSEIARITESNNINIQGVFIHQNKANHKLLVTIRTNKNDLRALLATFERYDYEVLNVYNSLENKEEFMDNYDLLMRYINI